jgi:hypothetical protein
MKQKEQQEKNRTLEGVDPSTDRLDCGCIPAQCCGSEVKLGCGCIPAECCAK